MNTLDGNLQENQLIYNENLKKNFLKNENIKKFSLCFLICGIVFLTIEVITHFFVVVRLGFRIGACDYDDKEKRKKCDEEEKINEKKFEYALILVLPLIVITIIVIVLGLTFNKKNINLNFICILIKISLFIGYIILICEILKDEGDSKYISSLIFPEIISDIFFLVNAILICFIKKIF